MNNEPSSGQDRRNFLKNVALTGGAMAGASALKGLVSSGAAAQGAPAAATFTSTSPWAKQVGLELFTVRDLTTDPASYQATLEKIAAIGYKEIEPSAGYAGMAPKEFRAMLDRLGLSMPSTHSGATEGPELEKQLEGFQIMGIQYAEISAPRAGGRGPAGAGGPGGAPGGGPAAGPGRAPAFNVQARSSDDVKRTADELNKHGEIAKKFGIKMLVHNHTVEFVPLSDKPEMTPYDIILANTDPALVAMQMDIGWATQAGQDPIAMFKKSPGRYELWHVKDMNDIKLMPPGTDEAKRMQMGVRAICPIGLGDIDYKPIFALAGLAGMKHFCIEQDSAADWGDSIASAGVCYKNLVRLLG